MGFAQAHPIRLRVQWTCLRFEPKEGQAGLMRGLESAVLACGMKHLLHGTALGQLEDGGGVRRCVPVQVHCYVPCRWRFGGRYSGSAGLVRAARAQDGGRAARDRCDRSAELSRDAADVPPVGGVPVVACVALLLVALPALQIAVHEVVEHLRRSKETDGNMGQRGQKELSRRSTSDQSVAGSSPQEGTDSAATPSRALGRQG